MSTWNTITSSYHLKVRSTQIKGITFFFCLGNGLLDGLFACLDRAKVFTASSNLTKSTFNVCMETLNELYVILTGFVLCL